MIVLICCMARNRVIGHEGRLPWRFPADLKHFKAVTSGNVVVMGRKTFEDVGLLSNRKLVVLTRHTSSCHTDTRGVTWTPDVSEAISLSADRDVFIAGGEQTYLAFLDLADYMMLTYLHMEVEGDARFPEFNADEWDVVTARRGNRHSYIEMRRR